MNLKYSMLIEHLKKVKEFGTSVVGVEYHTLLNQRK